VADLTLNEQLRDAIVRHQVGLLAFSGHVRNRIWKLLDATEVDLKRQLLEGVDGVGLDSPARVKRLNSLLLKLRKLRVKAWEQVDAKWFEELNNLARAEPAFMNRTLVGASHVELATTLPATKELLQIVKSNPFMGKTLSEWSKKVRIDDIARIESQVKIGLVQGETGQQIARRVVGTVKLKGKDGVTQIARRDAAAITRTAVSGIASDTREAYFAANADVMPKKIFLATLDSRTTPICRRYDGEVFEVESGDAPVLPLHFGERSMYSPIIDDELIGDRPAVASTQKQLLREYAKEANLSTVPTKRGQLPLGHKGAFDAFARVRKRALTGRVPSKTTYAQWLGRQNASFQNDILGPTRGKLFRSGNLSLDKFVEPQGRVRTLAELASQYPGAFEEAGLDPTTF
jgi:hypothetical protein